MHNLSQVTTISQIQSTQQSQVYTVKSNIETDGSVLVRLLQSYSSMVTTVMLAQKSSETTY